MVLVEPVAEVAEVETDMRTNKMLLVLEEPEELVVQEEPVAEVVLLFLLITKLLVKAEKRVEMLVALVARQPFYM